MLEFVDINSRVYDLKDPSGHVQCLAVADTHFLVPAEYINNLLPYPTAFERPCKFIRTPYTNDPSLMPDSNWTN